MVNDQAINVRLGEILRRERLRCGFKPDVMAERLRITVPAYLRYESGQRTIRPNTLAELARILGVQAGSLLDEAVIAAQEIRTARGIYELDSKRFEALVEREALHAQDLPRFVHSLDQAMRLVAMLLAGELGGAKWLLAKSLNPQFTHILRFLLSSDKQLASKSRGESVEALLLIYKNTQPATIDDRAAREQAAYIAGASDLPKARLALETAYESESDPWVRRAIVRGLAKAGLRADLSRHHEQELIESPGMQQVDVGFWRFYSGDEPRLTDALSQPPPDKGYRRTINALLVNIISGAPRADRLFDIRSLAIILRHATLRAISKDQRQVIHMILKEKPSGDSSVHAWEDLLQTARSHLGWRVTPTGAGMSSGAGP